MIYDSVPMSALLKRGILVGGNGWDNTEYWGKQIIKSYDKTHVERAVIKSPKKVPGIPEIDVDYSIKLGGPFEKIGDEDEAVGGDNQKVGKRNQ